MSEKQRLQKLADYHILDSDSEQDFDEIVELASHVLDTPISLISLLDVDRQWFKASVGLKAVETPREYAFCHHAIQRPNEVTVVRNSTLDDRFHDNPLVVGDPKIRFYAGAPLVKDGFALGTLCVIDTKPRDLAPLEEKLLKTLAARVIKLMDLRKENILQKQELAVKDNELNLVLNRFREAQTTALIGSWDWNTKSNALYWSDEMYQIFNLREGEPLLENWLTVVHPEDRELVRATIIKGLESKEPDTIEYRLLYDDGTEKWVETKGTVHVDQLGTVIRMNGTVQDITVRKTAESERQFYIDTLEKTLFDLSHKVRQPLTNFLALTNVLNDKQLTIKAVREFTPFLKTSAMKFDQFVREISEFIYQNKIGISKTITKDFEINKPLTNENRTTDLDKQRRVG